MEKECPFIGELFDIARFGVVFGLKFGKSKDASFMGVLYFSVVMLKETSLARNCLCWLFVKQKVWCRIGYCTIQLVLGKFEEEMDYT